MSVLIDLGAYLKEVGAFSRLAETFVDKASSVRLAEIERDLSRHIDTPQSTFSWSTREAIKFEASTKYDGPTKTHRPTHFHLSFNCAFTRPGRARKGCAVWFLSNSAVHVEIERDDVPRFKVHFDYKNPKQWGPQMHFQVAEDSVGIPVPRIPTGAFLPTDCADLMLSELHPTDWQLRQHQAASNADVAVLRDGQEYRTISYLKDIAKKWESREFTRFSMLQGYTSSVGALPISRDHVAKPGW